MGVSLQFLISITVIFYLVIDQSIQKDQCQTPPEYDLSNLTAAAYWIFDRNETDCVTDFNEGMKCHFYFALCKELPKIKGDTDCSNSSICQYNGGPDEAPIELGEFSLSPFTPKDTNGFYATFYGPLIYNRFNSSNCNVSVLMEFDCNKNAFWNTIDNSSKIGDATQYLTNFTSISATSCQYYMKFDYAGACHRINPPTTTTTITTTTEVNPPPSPLCVPPDEYDISALIKPPYWSFDISTGCKVDSNKTDACTLIMAFCKPLEASSCAGSSACVRFPNQGSSLVLGNFSSDPFITEGLEIDGFQAVYPPGDFITNPFTGKQCQLSIIVNFVCDADAIWPVPDDNTPGVGPEPIEFEPVTSKSCQLLVTLPYSGACEEIPIVPTGLSAGSILLIIFFVTVGVYLIFGGLYNKFINKQTGASIIPHFTFWTSTILFAFEGFLFAYKTITCKIKREERLKYDSI